MNPLQEQRATLYETFPTPEGHAYCNAIGSDFATIEAEAGCLVVRRVAYFRDRTFDFPPDDEPGGILSVLIEVLADDRETVLDLLAWPIGRPRKVASAIRRADVLGGWRISRPTLTGGPLRVFLTPESWLKGGCEGIAIVDPIRGAARLAAVRGSVVVENVEHGRELARMLPGYFDRSRILAPLRRAA